jgi:hypothetical protein
VGGGGLIHGADYQRVGVHGLLRVHA